MANKMQRYGVWIGSAVLLIVAAAVLSLIDWPTAEEKMIRQTAMTYCQAVQSADTIRDAWELTDKHYDEAQFLAPPYDSAEGVVREKFGPGEIHGDVGMVGVTRWYASGEQKERWIFFKKIDNEWKVELPGK